MLTLDNFSGHGDIDDLLNIIPSWLIIEFLPPNTTSIIQPNDGGIIARFKRLARKLLLHRLLAEADSNPEMTVDGFKKSTNVLHAVQLANEAWEAVTDEEIKKVWARTLLTENCMTIVAEGMTKAKREELNGLEREVLQSLVNMAQVMNQRGDGEYDRVMRDMGEEMVDEFVQLWLGCDDTIDREEVDIVDIIETMTQGEGDENSDDEPEVDGEALMSNVEARRQLTRLAKYFEAKSDDFNDGATLRCMVDRVDELAAQFMRQAAITEFFPTTGSEESKET